MRPSICRTYVRLVSAAVAAAGLVLAPSVAVADAPSDAGFVPSLTLPSTLPTTAPELPGPLADLPGTLASALPGASSPTTSATSTSAPRPTGSIAQPRTPGLPGLDGLTGQPALAPSDAAATTATASPSSTGTVRTPAADQPGATIGGGLAGLGHGCLSAGATNGGGLVVMGQDLLGQLTAVLPQTAEFVVPCTTTNGLAVDADLVAATLCLRLDPSQPAPLKATVELAGTDVLSQLEAAGLPLQQVLTPCSAAAAVTTTSPPTTATSSPTSTSAPDVEAARATPTADRLPFTGADVLPLVLFGSALLLLGLGLLRPQGDEGSAR
jgi:hypothetical protein